MPNLSMKLVMFACLLVASALEMTTATEYTVRGYVVCDTCLAGFETPATTRIAGAVVKVECRSRDNPNVKTCEVSGVTDKTGTYNIAIPQKHEHEICEVIAVSSPDSTCSDFVMGREKATVILNDNNGIVSYTRLANAILFKKKTPLAWCSELMQMFDPVDPFA